MKKVILLVLMSSYSFFGQTYDPSWGSGNGPEIYTCIFGLENFENTDPVANPEINGVRVHMEAIGDYWVQDGNGSFTKENNGTLYSDLIFPRQEYHQRDGTHPIDGLDTYQDLFANYWISSDLLAQGIEHAWYGFEFQSENLSPQLDDFADGLYKLSIEVESFSDDPNETYTITNIGYFYLDCRDSQLGYYNTNGIHNIDIWIRFDMPIKNENGTWIGKEGSFNVNVDNGVFVPISEHSTVRYWELKNVQGPTEIINIFNYTNLEVPQNFTITGGYNSHPVLSWSQVTNADSYYIYRALEDNGVYPYKLIGTTANTTWTDGEVTKEKFGTVKYHYNVSSEIHVNNTPKGYETIPSDTLVVTGNGPVYKSGGDNTLSNSILKFKLDNYPNPFNPSTIITFTVPTDAETSLIVYNTAGERTAVLVNNILQKGEYQIIFDAQNLSSGIYYTQLISGKYSKTIKIIYEK